MKDLGHDMSSTNFVESRRSVIHIGLDDTDNPKGDCTTYLATQIVEAILQDIPNSEFIDYPNLIRLMPNIPFKTRGNAAVAIRVRVGGEFVPMIIGGVKKRIQAINIIDEETNPAVVVLEGEVPPKVLDFGQKALRSIIKLREAKTILGQLAKNVTTFTRNGEQGLVGALAAIGSPLEQDHTFELLAYREISRCGTPRAVDLKSIMQVDNDPNLKTFNNIDPKSGRVLITPHGPDPILFGIRGESRNDVYEAFTRIRTGEPIVRWMIFRSNQGTDAHLIRRKIEDVQEYEPAVITGEVKSRPRRTSGGHVFCRLCDPTGEITMAAYEPSKEFRDIVFQLRPGDKVVVSGSVRKKEESMPLTLNLEKMLIQSLSTELKLQNPKCNKCKSTLSSMGRNKGFRCPKCRTRYPKVKKIHVQVSRTITPGLHIPPPSAQRHLTKPHRRYGREKKNYLPQTPKTPWHSVQTPSG